MKKVYLIIALILCLSTVATLVILNGKKNADDFDGNKDVSVSDDMTENDQKTETPDETKGNAGTEKSDLKDTSSYDSQIKLISEEFEYCQKVYYDHVSDVENPYAAVADLNRDGRLELLITDCRGNGAYSYSAFFKVSEDFERLSEMYFEPGRFIDTFGDFHENKLECYKKDDTYFYVVPDYLSEGYSFKSEDYYLYSFGSWVEREFIAGVKIAPDSDKASKKVLVGLLNSSGFAASNDDDYFMGIEDYLKDYEKQPVCELKWIPMPEDNYEEALRESFEGFNTDAGTENITDYDYKNLFDYYGDETIFTPWPTDKNSELFWEFLQNKTKLCITDKNNIGRYFNPYILEKHELTLSELKDNFVYSEDFCPTDLMTVDTVEYSIIDCGNDGENELALKISVDTSGEKYDVYIIIKNVNGRLETVYSNDAWSRRHIRLNRYGYIAIDGSGGAQTHGYDKEYVDALGERHFIYGNIVDTMTPNKELLEMGLNEEDYYAYLRFSFDEDNDNLDYSERKLFDTYAFRGDGFCEDGSVYNKFCYTNLVYDDSIYESDCPLAKFYADSPNKIYTIDEIEEMIAEKEEKANVTSVIKSGKDAVWYKIKVGN